MTLLGSRSAGVGVRLLALDMDGTLLTPDMRVPEAVVQAIVAARRMGVRVVLATGRMFASARRFADVVGVDGPLIAYNGAMICTLAGDILVHTPVPAQPALELVELAEEHDLLLNLYSNDQLYMSKMDERAEIYLRVAQVEPHVVPDLRPLALAGSTKALVVDQIPQAIEWEQKLARRFAGRLQVMRSNPEFVELINLSVSKGAALAALAKQLNVPPESVMAIGDSYNDLDMLAFAGIGVAVANAPLRVRQSADDVVASNAAGGVAEAIEKYILSRS